MEALAIARASVLWLALISCSLCSTALLAKEPSIHGGVEFIEGYPRDSKKISNSQNKTHRLDGNGDGSVSRMEVVSSHQRQLLAFDAADSDRNGKLSKSELKVFKAAANLRHCR
jgi:EF hand